MKSDKLQVRCCRSLVTFYKAMPDYAGLLRVLQTTKYSSAPTVWSISVRRKRRRSVPWDFPPWPVTGRYPRCRQLVRGNPVFEPLSYAWPSSVVWSDAYTSGADDRVQAPALTSADQPSAVPVPTDAMGCRGS